jgi:hypothetical protein
LHASAWHNSRLMKGFNESGVVCVRARRQQAHESGSRKYLTRAMVVELF